MGEESFTNPLLYIDQPEMTKPRAYMQEDYFGVNVTEVKEEADKENMEAITEENREGSFKELSTEQKIDYLVNLPSEVPKLRCEVVTSEKGYRGVMVKEDANTVTVTVFGRGSQVIDKEKIKDIQLLGF